jgi:hypothetical protein
MIFWISSLSDICRFQIELALLNVISFRFVRFQIFFSGTCMFIEVNVGTFCRSYTKIDLYIQVFYHRGLQTSNFTTFPENTHSHYSLTPMPRKCTLCAFRHKTAWAATKTAFFLRFARVIFTGRQFCIV